MPDKTPEEILKALDEVLDKQAIRTSAFEQAARANANAAVERARADQAIHRQIQSDHGERTGYQDLPSYVRSGRQVTAAEDAEDAAQRQKETLAFEAKQASNKKVSPFSGQTAGTGSSRTRRTPTAGATGGVASQGAIANVTGRSQPDVQYQPTQETGIPKAQFSDQPAPDKPLTSRQIADKQRTAKLNVQDVRDLEDQPASPENIEAEEARTAKRKKQRRTKQTNKEQRAADATVRDRPATLGTGAETFMPDPRIGGFQEEQAARAATPNTTPTVGTGENTAANARINMIDEAQREAREERAANAITPNLPVSDNAVTPTGTEQEAVRDNKGAWHLGGPTKPAAGNKGVYGSTEEDSTGTGTTGADADVNARIGMFDEEKETAAAELARERKERADRATKINRKRRQDPSYDPDFEERDPSDVPQTSENLEGYLTEEEEQQQAADNKEARLQRIEAGEEDSSIRNIPELTRREYRRRRAEREEVDAEKEPRGSFKNRVEARRAKRVEARAKKQEERAEKQRQKVLDERMTTSIGRLSDKDTKKTIERLTGKKGTGKGWRGTGTGAKTNVTTGQQNRDIVQNFITGLGAEQLETEQGKQWLESLKNIKTDENGAIVVEPDDPALEIWQTFAETMPDAEGRQYDKDITFGEEDVATTATREAGAGTGTQINSAEPSEQPTSTTNEEDVPVGQPLPSTPVSEATAAATPTEQEMVLENYWDGGRQASEGATTEQEQVLENYWEGVPENTSAEEIATEKNFSRTTVSAKQDTAIDELTQEGVIDDDIREAINNVLQDSAGQENHEGRRLIERLMLQFGTDRNQWRQWYQSQQQTDTTEEGPQLSPYANAQREQENIARRLAELGLTYAAKSGDGEIAKSVTKIIFKLDEIIKEQSPLFADDVETPSIKIIINDNFYKASQILKGLTNVIEKPPLRLFEKQDDISVNRLGEARPSMPTETQAAARPKAGHKGVPGKWSGAHLVPMYRTVHRKIPRELILRAIRWVNPKNFFKATTGQAITELSDDDWRAMDRDELIKNISILNEHREEALVISNRYSQMMSLIEQGQTPYAMLWNDPDKWMTLTDRMDRANGLKEGTAQWETQLDKTANRLQKIFAEEKFNTEDGEQSHFGMIDDLFDEEKGRIPFFKKLGKAGRGEKPWLRTSRASQAQTRFQPGTGRPAPEATPISRDAMEAIRSERYQLPSRRETLNASESDRQMEIMQQAPIYEGIRLPSEEALRGEGRLEMGPEQMEAITYSSPDEHPFLRTVNNPYGQWQEEAGVDATTVRSTRFVAETLNLIRSPEEVAQNQAYADAANASATAARQGVVDHSPDNLSDDVQGLVEDWFQDYGQLVVASLEDTPEGQERAYIRFPVEEEEARNANLAFLLDRSMKQGEGLNLTPSAQLHEAGGRLGYIMEDFNDVTDALTFGDKATKQAFQKEAYRTSFYKMMLLDLMMGTVMDPKAGRDTGAIRTLDGMGFGNTAVGENQWHPINLEQSFALTDEEGQKRLFPWNMFDASNTRGTTDAQIGFRESLDTYTMEMPAGYAPTEGIDYEVDIKEVIEEFLPSFNASANAFRGFSTDIPAEVQDLWNGPEAGLSGRITTQEQYVELKANIRDWMVKQMNQTM